MENKDWKIQEWILAHRNGKSVKNNNTSFIWKPSMWQPNFWIDRQKEAYDNWDRSRRWNM